VVKDPFGIYYIPGSSIKGAMKSEAARKNCKGALSDGKVECDKCEKVCCAFGGEEGGAGEVTSRIVITDLYPLIVPVPSLNKGVIFITSEFLIKRAEAQLSVGAPSVKVFSDQEGEERVFIGVEELTLKKKKLDETFLKDIRNINPLYSLADEIYLVDDDKLALILERSLVRLTRVRLDRKKKTVTSGMLWTEEYVPQGTLFLGLVGDRGWYNRYCNGVDDAVKEMLNLLGGNGQSRYV